MLNKIYIKNYILIDELELDFSKGLNIITGETGAGKSILINAIDIVFGARAGKEVIKNGAERAVIELTIKNEKQDISKIFEENGIDIFDNEIIISKEITQTASRSRINGCLVNQDFIKNFRELVLDIHSQHQTYSFLQPKYHIILLDSYIKSHKLNVYKFGYENYKNKLFKLDELKNSAQKTEEQLDFLRFQVNEIESAELVSISEDEDLNNE
jgi:DNA repair protein RecN (Recombination protein N)